MSYTDKEVAENKITNIPEDNLSGITNATDNDSHEHDHSHDHAHESDDKATAEKDEEEEEDDYMEDMFITPDATLGTDRVEWGGPRRGGRLMEPTRFGDWERKGRCTDF